MNKMIQTLKRLRLKGPSLTGIPIKYQIPETCPLSRLKFPKAKKRKKPYTGIIVCLAFNVQITDAFRKRYAEKNAPSKEEISKKTAKKWLTTAGPFLICIGEKKATPLTLNFIKDTPGNLERSYEEIEKEPCQVVALALEQVVDTEGIANRDLDSLLCHPHPFVRESGLFAAKNRGALVYTFPHPSLGSLDFGLTYDPEPDHFYTIA